MLFKALSGNTHEENPGRVFDRPVFCFVVL